MYSAESHPGGSFFEMHQERLARIFEIVGAPVEAADNLETAVEASQPWVKGDHSRPQHQFDPSRILRHEIELSEHYAEFGMTQRTPVVPGHYDDVVVLGAIHHGNNNRLRFLRQAFDDGRLATNRIMLLGGERRLFPERETKDIEKNIYDIGRELQPQPWVEALRSGDAKIEWETDMIRLAAIAQLGPLALERTVMRAESPDKLLRYEFSWRGIPLILNHTLAVRRPNGEPRHNTEACVTEYLDVYQPAEGAKIAFIGANPHLRRLRESFNAVLRRKQRTDLRVTTAGPAAPWAGHSIYLGEIARNLYEELRTCREAMTSEPSPGRAKAE